MRAYPFILSVIILVACGQNNDNIFDAPVRNAKAIEQGSVKGERTCLSGDTIGNISGIYANDSILLLKGVEADSPFLIHAFSTKDDSAVGNFVAKGQKIISSAKVSQGEVLKLIKSLDMSRGFPKGMSVAPKEKLYYMQRDAGYAVSGNGDNVIGAKKYKLNLYFNPFKRADDQISIEQAAGEQSRLMDEIIASKKPVVDMDDIVKQHNLLNITFKKNGSVASYTVNEQKKDTMLQTAGFFASKTVGVDFTPLEAMDNYGMRDEQEKCFGLQKGPLGQDRLRTWSEAAKHGRMFVCFIGLILASYVRSVHKQNEYLRTKFASIEDILAEMRSIRCIEHEGRLKFITPFVGAQVDICKAFGFDIPDGCAPTYTSRKKSLKPRRGRPAKPKVEHQEL